MLSELTLSRVDIVPPMIDVPFCKIDLGKGNVDVRTKNIEVWFRQIDFVKGKIDVPKKNIDVPKKNIDVPKTMIVVRKTKIDVKRKKFDALCAEIANRFAYAVSATPGILQRQLRSRVPLPCIRRWHAHRSLRITRQTVAATSAPQ
jgi:hypothetical protein